jgi:outer membrane biosynthesis protein TonB
VSRFSNAVLAALALHGLLFFSRARHVSARPTPIATRAAEELIEVEAPSVEEASRDLTTGSDATRAAAQTAHAALSAQSRAMTHSQTETPSAEIPEGADAPAADATPNDALAANSAQPNSDPAPRKIDLGLDGHFFMRPPSEEFPRVHKSVVQQQLEAAIAADDVKHGLARGNALLGSLNAAVRDKGPVRGEALLRVTVGPDGTLTDLEFLRGSASDWASALQSFRELAARKHVRVPPGARGLRVTFSIKAKVQLPSGEEVRASVDSPSLAPNGMTLKGTFDVGDIGSGPQRLVYAHVVSEEVL